MRWVKNILGGLILLGLLSFVLKDINFYEVYLLMSQTHVGWFLLAFLATGLTFLSTIFNWKSIFREILKFDFLYFMKVTLAGAFFNTVTPSAGLGGEPFRVHYLASKYKKPKSEILGGVIADSFFRMLVLFAFVLFSIGFILFYVQVPTGLKWVLMGVLCFVFVASFGVFYIILHKSRSNWKTFFRKIYWFKFIKRKFATEEIFVQHVRIKANAFYGNFEKVLKNKQTSVMAVLFGGLFWLGNFLTAYFLFRAFDYHVSFLFVIVVFALGQIIGSLSPVPGGMGVVESIMTLLYTMMGIPLPLALLVAFLQRMIYYFYSLVLGGISLVNLKILEEKI
jgi:hypothetical protein